MLHKICVAMEITMEYPPEPPHDHDIELSDDSQYHSDPEKGISASQKAKEAKEAKEDDEKLD